MRKTIVCLLACFALASGKKDPDCSVADAQIAKLTAEVDSLRKQLASGSGTCSSEFSVIDAVSKSSSIVGDVVNHLLDQTTVDDKVVGVVSTQIEAARALGSQVVGQITSHPCSSDYNECVKTLTSSDIYKTHLAPHVDTVTKAAQPHVATVQPHMDTALKTAKTAYSSAVDMAGVVREKSGVAYDQVSTLAGQAPDHFNTVLDPAFVALQKASPNHHHVLPKKALDRLLLICIVLVFIYNFWGIARFFTKLLILVTKLALYVGIKLPFKVTVTTMSWSFFFGTGFYVCGLCRSRKATGTLKKKSADAKSEPKKGGKPTTEKELSTLLDKAKEKGKLNDGVTRLAEASKSGKPLQAPEEMKGKVVSKDVLKKVLAKYKEVDVKKLGL